MASIRPVHEMTLLKLCVYMRLVILDALDQVKSVIQCLRLDAVGQKLPMQSQHHPLDIVLSLQVMTARLRPFFMVT